MADIRRLVTLTTVTNRILNASGEVDATNWTAASGAGSASTPAAAGGARTGSSGVKHVETTGTGVTSGQGIWLNASPASIPISPDQEVWAYGWMRPGTSASDLTLSVQWFDAGDTYISQDPVQYRTSPTTGTWYEMQGTAVAPANAASCSLTARMTNSTTTPVLWADDFAVVVSDSYAGPWFEGTATLSALVNDLEVDQKLIAARDTFSIKAPERTVVQAGSYRRYAGTRAVSDSHANATAQWKLLVKDTTADLASKAVEAVLQPLEALNTPGLHLEWRPDGNTESTFYEVRGPATWQLGYSRIRFSTTQVYELDVTIPISPLGRGGGAAVQSFGSQASPVTTPAVVQLSQPITGTAPAQAAMTISRVDNASNPSFVAIGWWNRLPAPPTGYTNCYGLIQGEATKTGTTPTGWTSAGHVDASGGNLLQNSTSEGPGTAKAQYAITTEGITGPTVDIEVWGRTRIAWACVAPRFALSFSQGVGAPIYTREWGLAGRPLVPGAYPSIPFRMTRLGSVTLPVKDVSPLWTLTVDAAWSDQPVVGLGPVIGLDYLMLLPANSRACSPSGEAFDVSYPKFMQSASNTGDVISKTIHSDLSGTVSLRGIDAADTGLGGALLEFPPGEIDVGLLCSEIPPDSPAVDGLSAPSLDCWLDFNIVPRYFAVNGG